MKQRRAPRNSPSLEDWATFARFQTLHREFRELPRRPLQMALGRHGWLRACGQLGKVPRSLLRGEPVYQRRWKLSREAGRIRRWRRCGDWFRRDRLRWRSASPRPLPRRPRFWRQRPSRTLAARTIMGAAAGNDHPVDQRPAAEAFLPRPTIDLVNLLEPAGAPLRIHVARNRRATERDSLGQCIPIRLVESRHLPPAQRGANGSRMQPGPAQAFVSINIPQATQKALIEEQALEHRPAGMQPRVEILWRDFHRIGSQCWKIANAVFDEAELPEPARVAEVQPAARRIQAEDQMSMWPQRLGYCFKLKAPRHSKMHQQAGSCRVLPFPAPLDQDVLSMAANFFHSRPAEPFLECRRRLIQKPPQHPPTGAIGLQRGQCHSGDAP